MLPPVVLLWPCVALAPCVAAPVGVRAEPPMVVGMVLAPTSDSAAAAVFAPAERAVSAAVMLLRVVGFASPLAVALGVEVKIAVAMAVLLPLLPTAPFERDVAVLPCTPDVVGRVLAAAAADIGAVVAGLAVAFVVAGLHSNMPRV